MGLGGGCGLRLVESESACIVTRAGRRDFHYMITRSLTSCEARSGCCANFALFATRTDQVCMRSEWHRNKCRCGAPQNLEEHAVPAPTRQSPYRMAVRRVAQIHRVYQWSRCLTSSQSGRCLPIPSVCEMVWAASTSSRVSVSLEGRVAIGFLGALSYPHPPSPLQQSWPPGQALSRSTYSDH